MKIKKNAAAVLLGMAVVLGGAASSALASSNITRVLTDPCAKVMNWPVRPISFTATPPSERGLQCPIQQDFAAPLND
jgi:hypothetical protein